jgi:hypothetical protein
MSTERKPRYEKKETLGKNIVRNFAYDARGMRYLDVTIGSIYDKNKAQRAKYQDRMTKLDQLYQEFYDDPNAFLSKYAEGDMKAAIEAIL